MAKLRRSVGAARLISRGERQSPRNVSQWLDELIRNPVSEDCFREGWRNQPQFPAA